MLPILAATAGSVHLRRGTACVTTTGAWPSLLLLVAKQQ